MEKSENSLKFLITMSNTQNFFCTNFHILIAQSFKVFKFLQSNGKK